MKVALDGTPLLGARTGVGQYVAHLVDALAALPEAPEIVLTAFTWRGRRELPAVSGATVRTRPLPARLLRAAWSRTSVPPVEWLCGSADVFHATNFVLPPARRCRGVVTVHDLSFELMPEAVTADVLAYRRLVPRGIRRAAVVVTPSHTVADELADTYRLDRDRIAVTPLGVDPRWFDIETPDTEWLRARGLPDRYVLFVGSVSPRKNLDVLVRAYELLLDDGEDMPPLVLAGPAGWGTGPDVGRLPPGAIRRTGYLPHDELRTFVAGAACLAFPSKYEGFGLPPLEALAAGTPVIAGDIPVLREVLGKYALFVSTDDAPAWAAALRDIVRTSDGAIDTAIGAPGTTPGREDGRSYARRWTWQHCAATTLDAYQRASY